jgi:hypothetical protein
MELSRHWRAANIQIQIQIQVFLFYGNCNLKYSFSLAVEEHMEDITVEDGNEMRLDPIPPQEFHLALKIICAEVGKAQRAYATRRCEKFSSSFSCRMKLLSDRYAIDAEHNAFAPPIFNLVDILHNEKM